MSSWLKKIIVFLVSQTITLIGSLVVGYAVVWYITIETSSGLMMTIAVLCNCLPQIIISLFAGVWADRYNRKLLIIASDAFTALATLVLAIAWLNGNTSMTFIFIVMAARSFGAGVQQPAVNALIPQIVPVEQLTRINAINTTIMNTLTLLAPALGGALLASSFVNALFFDVITAAIGITVLCFLAVGKMERGEASAGSSMVVELKEGLKYVRHTDWLRFMLVVYAVGFFLISPASYLSPIFVERIFGPEIWRLTANEIFWSVGAIIGGIIIAAWGGFKNRIFSMAFSFLFFGIAFALMGIVHNFWFYLAIMGIAGLFLPMFTTAEMTFIQEKTDEQMMGRVFSLINIIVAAAMPLAMIIFGPLADVVNIRYIMISSGLVIAVLAIYLLTNKRLLAFDNTGRPEMIKNKQSTVGNMTADKIEEIDKA